MRIQTQRLIITHFDPGMAQDVHLNSLDEDMRRFTPDEVFETVEDAGETLEFLISRYGSDEGPLVYPVLLKDGSNIGYVQLVRTDEAWEIGYHIAKHHSGMGYASEAASALLDWAKREMDIGGVIGICAAENTASRKVLEKCGFELCFEGDGAYQGKIRKICKYRILFKK